jgi:hypothetical protein
LRIYILNRRFGFGGRKRGGGGFLGFEERRERVSDRERNYFEIQNNQYNNIT